MATYLHEGRLSMALNWHKGGSNVGRIINLYVIMSDDLGSTWKKTDEEQGRSSTGSDRRGWEPIFWGR